MFWPLFVRWVGCVVIIIGGLIYAWCLLWTWPRQAMSEVFQARLEARQSCFEVHRGGLGSFTNFNSSAFSAKLKAIDTRKCPRQFRVAWLDYVHASERFANYNLVGAARDLAELAPVNALHGGAVDVSRRWEKMHMAEYWRAVQRSALEFGVDTPPDS